ncbi:hypothetical protein ACFV1C_00045 [Streptomyces sp. NPDC059605]|uniref:hypothetical protein n=1 Tax=Streptomyces sp. NPDC059605 TaxID=3346882 RepID=UPI003674A923
MREMIADFLTHTLQRIHQDAAQALADDPEAEGVIVHPVFITPTGPVPMDPFVFARAPEAPRG